jgi:glycogen debranching enzyme
MLRDQLSFCAAKQGQKKNPYDGEEPGKIFHEYPGVELRGLSTQFNTCDATALFLMGYEAYETMTGDKSLIIRQRKSIERGVEYILSHLDKDLFIESPEFCDADSFALKVTYWKDSEIPERENGEPVYPVVYTLAHIQNMRGLRSAARVLGSKDLEKTAERMRKGLQKLYDHKTGVFYIAIDQEGPIRGVSSDSLHALFYLEPEDLSDEQLKKIVESSTELETPLGYMALSPRLTEKVKNPYHAKTVWPFEQAIIHNAARKFGLERVAKVSSQITRWLDTDPEIFILDGKEVRKSGCDPQLWTIAAKKYFKTIQDKHLAYRD